MAEKISIITISYNSQKTIEKTILSILGQSYRPLEYVLVDGGSKDGTIELIKKYIPELEKAGIEVNYNQNLIKEFLMHLIKEFRGAVEISLAL